MTEEVQQAAMQLSISERHHPSPQGPIPNSTGQKQHQLRIIYDDGLHRANPLTALGTPKRKDS
eukprot:798208-Amphidinium_carterae.1